MSTEGTGPPILTTRLTDADFDHILTRWEFYSDQRPWMADYVRDLRAKLTTLESQRDRLAAALREARQYIQRHQPSDEWILVRPRWWTDRNVVCQGRRAR